MPAFVTALMDDAGISPDQLNAQEKRALREVVLNHRSMLQATVDTQSDYLAALNELSDNRATLAQLVREDGVAARIATHNLEIARRMDRAVTIQE